MSPFQEQCYFLMRWVYLFIVPLKLFSFRRPLNIFPGDLPGWAASQVEPPEVKSSVGHKPLNISKTTKMVHIQFVCSRKEITGKKHTEPITTDKQCRGDSPSSGKSRGLLYVVSRSCDYGPFTLFAMAPERPRLMLQNPMFYCSHGLLLLLLSITAANLPRALFTGLDFWCCVS